MAENKRHIEVEGGYNVRDLGGYPTAAGKMTRWRTLVRAGTLDKLTARGQRQLADYGVKTIVDLRDEEEARDYPDLYVQPTAYLNLPFFGDALSAEESWQKMWMDVRTLHELYHSYFDRCQSQIKTIISAVAESQPGILFHCYAGKDRTGMIAALLLSSVGVPASVIAEDYARTGEHIQHLFVQWHEEAEKNGTGWIADRDSGFAAETMLAALDYIEQRYDGVECYMRLCGITDQQFARLQTLLVE